MSFAVQSPSHVQPFATSWTAARQASLPFTISWSLLKLMSTESMIPSNHLILCRPLLLLPSVFSSIRPFPMSQLFTSVGQSIGTSASVLVLPMNIHSWLPLGLTDLISLESKGLSRVFSSTTIQKHHQFFSSQSSLGFHGGSGNKVIACNAGDPGSIPGSGGSPGEGNGYPLQYSAWRIPWTKTPGELQSMGS